MTVKKKPDQPSVVEQMEEDAAPDYPPATPVLRPLRQIRPFSKRAEFKRALGEFETVKDRVQAMKDSGVFDPESKTATDRDRINASADMDEMYGQMDELLAMAAADADAYRAWSEQLEDENDLIRVFNVYMRVSQPGEVPSSTS